MSRNTSGCGSCGSSGTTSGTRFRSTRAANSVSLQQTTASCGTVTVTEPDTQQPPEEEQPPQNGDDGDSGTGETPSDTGGLDTETAVLLGGAALGAAYVFSQRQ